MCTKFNEVQVQDTFSLRQFVQSWRNVLSWVTHTRVNCVIVKQAQIKRGLCAVNSLWRNITEVIYLHSLQTYART